MIVRPKIKITRNLALIKSPLFLPLFTLSILCSFVFPQKEYHITEIIQKDNNWHYILDNTIVNGQIYRKIGNFKYFLGRIKKGKKHGSWVKWYEHGKKYNEEIWEDGAKVEGYLTLFSKNGQKSFQTNLNFKTGDGEVTQWHENGQKWIYEKWTKNKLVKEVSWYINGQKEKELIWNPEDYRSFSYKFWHKNSLRSKVLVVDNGKLVEEKCWSFEGNIILCK